MARFDGKVAIVTGGALGIGGATARRLATDGARVLIADVEEAAAGSNVQRIRDDGGTADGVRGMVERAVDLWGRLDIVVNNAYSGGMRGDAVELGEESWDRAM